MIFPPPPLDSITMFGMLLLTLAVAWRASVTMSGGNLPTRKWLTLVLALVMAISAVAASFGQFSRMDFMPSSFQIFTATVLCATVVFGLSPLGRRLADQSILGELVLLQAFRLPLEVLMYRAALQGIMPQSFSFVGKNFDILTGSLALLLGIALVNRHYVPRWALHVWNLWGIACLIVIGVLAVTLSPNQTTIGRDASQVLSWVLFFPYSWLPHILVPIAILGHLLISLKLIRTKKC
jgi:hypothetical protein